MKLPTVVDMAFSYRSSLVCRHGLEDHLQGVPLMWRRLMLMDGQTLCSTNVEVDNGLLEEY